MTQPRIEQQGAATTVYWSAAGEAPASTPVQSFQVGPKSIETERPDQVEIRTEGESAWRPVGAPVSVEGGQVP